MIKAFLRHLDGPLSPAAAILILVLGGFALYANSLQGEFQYDDYSFIVESPAVHDPFNLHAIWKQYPSRFVGTLTFALNYFLGGHDPTGYHLVNLWIHILNAVLVFVLVRLTLATPRVKTTALARDKDLLAFGVALLFLSHPLATTAVNHVTQRYTSLVAFFYLASLVCYAHGRLGANGVSLLGALACLTLGMLTKQTAVTIPAMLWVYEICFFRGGYESSRRPRWVFAGMMVMVAIFFWKVFSYRWLSLASQHLISQSHDGDVITLYNYLLSQPRVLLTYLRLLIVPWGLNFDPDFRVSSSFWEPATFLSVIVLGGLLTLGVRGRRKYPLLAFGVFWFFITLSVESSFFPIAYLIAEYRAYLPSVGFFLTGNAILFYGIKSRRKFLFVLTVFVLIYSFLAIQRNRVWQNEIVFWQDVIAKSPQKARPYHNLGTAYLARGDRERAMAYFQKVFDLNPLKLLSSYNLAKIYITQGDFDLALSYLRRAQAIDRHHVCVLNGFGLYYLGRNELTEAEKLFQEAIQKFPKYMEPRLNLAEVYLKGLRLNDAISTYSQVLEKFPNAQGAYIPLVQLFFQSGDMEKARALGVQILDKGYDPQVLTNAGSLFAANGYGRLAEALYQKSLKIDPKKKETYLEWGKFLGNQGSFDAAIALWRRGARLDSQDDRFRHLMEKAEKLRAVTGP